MAAEKVLRELIKEINKLLSILKANPDNAWYHCFLNIKDKSEELIADGFSHEEIMDLSRLIQHAYTSEPSFNDYIAPKGTIGLERMRRRVMELKIILVAKSLEDLGVLDPSP